MLFEVMQMSVTCDGLQVDSKTRDLGKERSGISGKRMKSEPIC